MSDTDSDDVKASAPIPTPIELPISPKHTEIELVYEKLNEEYHKYRETNPISLRQWLELPVSGEDIRTNFTKYREEMRKHRYTSPAAENYREESRKYEVIFYS